MWERDTLLDSGAGSPSRYGGIMTNCLRELTVPPDYMKRQRSRGQVYQGLGQDPVFTEGISSSLEPRTRPKREEIKVAAAMPGI